jgi:hypothetical protein
VDPVAHLLQSTLHVPAGIQSKSALGAFGRRLHVRMDAPRAIKALAHSRVERDRLAKGQPAGRQWRLTSTATRLIYRMLSAGAAYKDIGEHYYEERYRAHLIARLQKHAEHFGFHLTPQQGK